MSGVAEGQVRQSQYGVDYHVLAIWDQWAWVLVYARGLNPMEREPKTMPVAWLQKQRIKHDLRMRAASGQDRAGS